MKAGQSTEAVEPSRYEPRGSRRSGVLAFVEVLIACLLTPVLWQGFKHFTTLGRMEVSAGFNFSSGIATILVAICLFLWHRKRLADYGVSLSHWPDHLRTGLGWAVILIILFSPMRFGFYHYNGISQIPYGSWKSPVFIDASVAFFIIALFPWIFRILQGISIKVPISLALLILFCLWTTPLTLAYYQHRSVAHFSLVVSGLIITTGFGEEVFYWGYIQPRLDEVLGRPYCFGGIPFGSGLLVTAFLFGFVHTLNGVDFLHGHFNLNWGWGFVAFVAGLGHGLLRERTGSILAGTIVHGINDTWVLIVIPMLFAHS
jgi:membrane protease YdiL (CAAX protease family)